jgi:hypothetical protein
MAVIPSTTKTGRKPQSRCWPCFLPFGGGIGKSVRADTKKIKGHNFAYVGESVEQPQACCWSAGLEDGIVVGKQVFKGCCPTIWRNLRRKERKLRGILFFLVLDMNGNREWCNVGLPQLWRHPSSTCCYNQVDVLSSFFLQKTKKEIKGDGRRAGGLKEEAYLYRRP